MLKRIKCWLFGHQYPKRPPTYIGTYWECLTCSRCHHTRSEYDE